MIDVEDVSRIFNDLTLGAKSPDEPLPLDNAITWSACVSVLFHSRAGKSNTAYPERRAASKEGLTVSRRLIRTFYWNLALGWNILQDQLAQGSLHFDVDCGLDVQLYWLATKHEFLDDIAEYV